MAAPLTVSVVSADREVWTGEASQIIAKTVEGEIGILAGHEPMLAILAGGEVRVTALDGSRVVVDAADGFLSVDNNVVQVVAGRASIVA
ncbi:F0F1 ATP synthase subunit epsilon [Lysinibacter cavernae]|uniref:F-type H+-transporting ATPase subunit epsilon n=1 Tax=Lysinibacter cavernae TaxID=1640652 RepID=A0A7X5R4B4_9MICO|nr:F0F1 ATP synthase subunit epsilon [Lysinibacter cavernae]NIH55316.1 F-type H+-transporting ATPase subunit epsilon [Lysinibacter cavernae]